MLDSAAGLATITCEAIGKLSQMPTLKPPLGALLSAYNEILTSRIGGERTVETSAEAREAAAPGAHVGEHRSAVP